MISELLQGELEIHSIYGSEEWLKENEFKLEGKAFESIKVSPKELDRISGMKNPNKVLAVVKRPTHPLPQTEDFEDLILALGVLAFVICPLFGLAAWLMGRGDLQAMRQGRMDPAGMGLTQAGMVLGIVQVAMTALALLFFLALLMFGLLASQA